MKKVRSILAVAAAGVTVLTMATAATASEGPDVDAKFENGVLRFSSSMPNQPLFGGFVDTNTGKACMGFSYQVPQCATLPVPGIAIGTLPVRIDTNKDDDGVVGVFTGYPSQPLLSVWWNTRGGEICAGFSYQIPFCIEDN